METPAKRPTTIDDLLRAVQCTIIDQRQANALNARLEAAEARFEEEDRRRAVTEEFLNRSYDL